MGIKSQLFFKNAFGNHCKREDQDVLKRWLMALIGDLLEWSYVPYDQSSLLTEYLFCQTFFEILVFTNTFGNHCISEDQEALKRWLIALIGDLLSWSKKKAFQVASNLQLSKELMRRKKSYLKQYEQVQNMKVFGYLSKKWFEWKYWSPWLLIFVKGR